MDSCDNVFFASNHERVHLHGEVGRSMSYTAGNIPRECHFLQGKG